MTPGDRYRSTDKIKDASGHTAIDIATRAADSGAYFLDEAHRAGSSFSGELRVRDGGRLLAEKLLQDAAQTGLRIGHAKSRGMGSVQVFFSEEFERETPTEERLAGFNGELRRRAGWEASASFSVTLESRAVLLDEYLQYRSRVGISDILEAGRAAGVKPDFEQLVGQFKPLTIFTGTEEVFGWNGAANMPRSPDVAVRGGAAFLFVRRAGPLTEQEFGVLSRGFEVVESVGIGERTAEGFGRVRICDPFHWKGDYDWHGNDAGERCVLH